MARSQVERMNFCLSMRHHFEGQTLRNAPLIGVSARASYLKAMKRHLIEHLRYIPSKRHLSSGVARVLNASEVSGELGLLVRLFAKFLRMKLPCRSSYLTDTEIADQKGCCNFVASILSLLEKSHGIFCLQHLWFIIELQQNEMLEPFMNSVRKRYYRALEKAYAFGDFLLSCLPNNENVVPIWRFEGNEDFSIQEKELILRLGEIITADLALVIRVALTNWILYFNSSIQSSFLFYYEVKDFNPDDEFLFGGPSHDPVYRDLICLLSKFLYSPISGIINDDSGVVRNLAFIYIRNIIFILRPVPRRKTVFKISYLNNLPKFFYLNSHVILTTWTNLPFLYFSLAKLIDFLIYSNIISDLQLDIRDLCRRIEIQLAEQRRSSHKLKFISDFYQWPK